MFIFGYKDSKKGRYNEIITLKIDFIIEKYYILQNYRYICETNTNAMTLNEYQEGARRTAIYPTERKIIYPTLGLTGEAGEVADKVKKVIRDNNDEFTAERKHQIAMELGDVMWYAASLAHDLGYTLDEVCQMNLDKLASRMKRDKIHGEGDER